MASAFSRMKAVVSSQLLTKVVRHLAQMLDVAEAQMERHLHLVQTSGIMPIFGFFGLPMAHLLTDNGSAENGCKVIQGGAFIADKLIQTVAADDPIAEKLKGFLNASTAQRAANWLGHVCSSSIILETASLAHCVGRGTYAVRTGATGASSSAHLP